MKTKVTTFFIASILILFGACNNKPADNENTADKKNEQSLVEATDNKLLAGVEQYIAGIEDDFAEIQDERKAQLKKLALYIDSKSSAGETSNLIFICTHNSRRSHMSQIWAQSAAYHYGITNVNSFSGGTEATAFNHRSVRALRKAGFEIEQTDSSSNPVYLVKYAEEEEPIKGFSKKYDDEFNPQENFVAIMTCSEADKTCPQVSGSTLRVAIPYVDPKEADDTPEEEARYDERCRQIATEMFYIFSQVKAN
jgi:arsenate reductase (thioredoxin)